MACKVTWYSVKNGTQRKVKAASVRKAMGAAYQYQLVDICRNGPSTIVVGGKRFFGTPVARTRPKTRRTAKRRR